MVRKPQSQRDSFARRRTPPWSEEARMSLLYHLNIATKMGDRYDNPEEDTVRREISAVLRPRRSLSQIRNKLNSIWQEARGRNSPHTVHDIYVLGTTCMRGLDRDLKLMVESQARSALQTNADDGRSCQKEGKRRLKHRAQSPMSSFQSPTADRQSLDQHHVGPAQETAA